MKLKKYLLASMLIILTACLPAHFPSYKIPTPALSLEVENTPVVMAYPTRPAFQPGELVDYTAQTGDTLPALAVHFNTTIDEIRSANPIIPPDVTTLPAGFPMKIPIYYQPLLGNPFQIIPDQLFINGPAQRDFDAVKFVKDMPGWFKSYKAATGVTESQGGEIINHIATNFSISPRLLLAILEYQTGALTKTNAPEEDLYLLGYEAATHQTLYQQLIWAANVLNNGYYGWRSGTLTSLEFQDSRMQWPDPWQNAATVGIQYYFSQIYTQDLYEMAVSEYGVAKTYENLFGAPFTNPPEPHIPGSLQQPEMRLPFQSNLIWAFTGGPHTGWGTGEPWSAIDFAPSNTKGGCTPSSDWVVAIADGMIVRSANASLSLDLDGDGDERTGWVVYYLHLGGDNIPKVGEVVTSGTPIGHPSCEGGRSTGTHIHIARKYNGEWILAGGTVPFVLEGLVARNGAEAYQGYLEKNSFRVQANMYGERESQLQSYMP